MNRKAADEQAANPDWRPVRTWRWDRNTTHNAKHLYPILVFVRFMPRRLNRILAAGLGSVLAYAMRKTRRVVGYNIRMALRGRAPARGLRREILSTFQNYACCVVDFMEMSFMDGEAVRTVVEHLGGRGVFDGMLEAGNGCILVTPHLGHWELGGALLAADGYPVNVTGLMAADPWTKALRDGIRERLGMKTIPMNESGSPLSSIPLVNALRRNEFVAMLTDRDSSSRSLKVPFLGGSMRMSSGAAVLSFVTGAPILPVYVVRGAGGKYFAGNEPPIYPGPFGRLPRDRAIEAITAEMAKAFERMVGRHFNQWYNFFPDWEDDRDPAGLEAAHDG